jgi:hypothetical protein
MYDILEHFCRATKGVGFIFDFYRSLDEKSKLEMIPHSKTSVRFFGSIEKRSLKQKSKIL